MSVDNPEQNVYRVTDCTVTIDGDKYPVASVTLTLQHNMWPSLVLLIDPYHLATSESTSEDQDAVVASLAMFTVTFLKLQAIILDEARRESSFYCSIEGGAEGVQELNLEGWLLTGAGVVGDARGGFQIELALEHPLRKINESTINFYGLPQDPSFMVGPDDFSDATDVLDGVQKGMNKFYEMAQNAVVSPDLQDMFQLMLDRFTFVQDALADHLLWGGEEAGASGWPTAPFEGLASSIPYSIWATIDKINNATGWGWFSRDILSGYSLSMIPTFWQPELLIVPYEPWAEPVVFFKDTDVTRIQLPPTDGAPVCGVLLALDNAQLGNFSLLDMQSSVENTLTEGVVWIEDGLPGAIPQIGMPPWLDAAISAQSGGTTALPGDNGETMFSNSGTEGAEEGLSEPADELINSYREGFVSVTKEFFLEYFRQSYEIAIVCRFMLTQEGEAFGSNYIIPGCVFELNADTAEAASEDTTTLRFFATRVVHSISRQDNTASTVISGQYLRDSDSLNLKAIPEGVGRNALYFAAGE